MPTFLTSLFSSLLLLLGTVFPSLPQKLNSQDPIDVASITGDFDAKDTLGDFHGQQFSALSDTASSKPRTVLGDSDAPKRIEVDLSTQRLYAFEGDRKVYDFLISSGKWGRTPTGTFSIWGKFRYTKMSGGNRDLNTYYYLPNVPYVMFFDNDQIAASRGFSLHGTYWHDNFGHPMSHGCINMRTEDAQAIFYWSNPSVGDKKSIRTSTKDEGTKIIIYGTAPRS